MNTQNVNMSTWCKALRGVIVEIDPAEVVWQVEPRAEGPVLVEIKSVREPGGMSITDPIPQRVINRMLPVAKIELHMVECPSRYECVCWVDEPTMRTILASAGG